MGGKGVSEGGGTSGSGGGGAGPWNQRPMHGGGAPGARGGSGGGSRAAAGAELGGHHRVPPHDLDAEKAVLSAILLDNSAIHEIVTEISVESFYHPAHQALYAAMVFLKDSNQPVDLVTLADYLKSNDLLESVGGPVALAEIADYEASAANIVHYARIIREKSVRRGLISVAAEIVNLGYDEVQQSDQALDEAESKIFALSQEQAKSSLSPMDVEVHAAIDHIEMLINRGGDLTGLPTDYTELDAMTGGLQPGDLIIIAARPSMGKTALALNLARNIAVGHGNKVAVFSLEMTTQSLVMRLLASEARVDASAFRNGFISVEDHGKLVHAAEKLAAADIWIDDTPAASVLEIRAKCRRMHAQRGLDLVIVDYLQLARAGTNIASREQEISEISRGLKGLAKELNVPVIALSQLNRGPETRKEDKRPILADLRESGAIEQDADIIGFIYRDVVYNPETEHQDKAELLIRKQRNGPTGTVDLEFLGRYALFKDWPEQDPYAPPPIGGDSGGGGFDSGGGVPGGGFGGGSHSSDGVL
ncbi:MAG: replicative DNA helicase [Myxococcota bacterium]|jgi:replicative DNA helicase|nr:replicative DNA helicase [Myxococcota bacterium]